METFDLGTCRETRLVLSGTLSTSCACANPNTLMRLICKKQESGLLSTFSFLYALCQTKYTTHNTHQTKVQKKRISDAFQGLFPAHTLLCSVQYKILFIRLMCKKTKIPTYLDSGSFFLRKQWNIFPSTGKTGNCLAGQLDSHLTRWNNFFLSNTHANTEHVGEPYHSFFFNQLCSVKCFYSDWLNSQPVKLPRFSPPSLDETRYNSKLFLDRLVVKPSFKSLGIQVSFSSCLL